MALWTYDTTVSHNLPQKLSTNQINHMKKRLRINMNKKIIAIIAIVAIVVIAIGAVLALVILPGLFTPPVDISGVSPSTSLTGQELLPSTVAGEQLVIDSNYTETLTADTGTRTFDLEHTRAQYNGIYIHIFKAEFTSDASDTLTLLLDDEDWYGSPSSYTQTNDWFTAVKEGRSVFFWRSGTWIFGVDAENDNTRNNAANDLVQHLRTL